MPMRGSHAHGASRATPAPADSPVAFGPSRATTVGVAVLGLTFVALAFGTDAAGRLLTGLAAALLLGGAGWLSVGPVLVADAERLTVRTGWHRHVLGWEEVRGVLVDNRRRSRAIEVETADGLLSVPALLLGGVTVAAAAAALETFRPTGGASPPAS